VVFDVSASKIIATWTSAMKAHASQAATRKYIDLQLARARVRGLQAGVEHAIALFPNDPLVIHSLIFSNAARGHSDMSSSDALQIGITCYPSIGGSGILASALEKNWRVAGMTCILSI